MKRVISILLVLALTLCVCAGCATQEEELNSVAGVANVQAQEGGSNGGDTTAPGDTTTPEGNNGDTTTPEGNGDTTTPEGNNGDAAAPGANDTNSEGNGSNANQSNPAETIDYTTDEWITICSYNIKVLNYDHVGNRNGQPMSKYDAVCAELKKIDADIVGLQEVDRFTTRSGAEVDQLLQLAKGCGYKYYYYTKTIDAHGGEYGHGVMSRYKMTNSRSFYFKEIGTGLNNEQEGRAFSRHEIKINGKWLVFYNSHLASPQDKQAAYITAMMEKDMKAGKYAVMTADTNYLPNQLNFAVDEDLCTMLNTIEGAKNTTYQGWINPTQHTYNMIDNIIVTNNLEYYWNSKEKSGIIVTNTSASDHLPIHTYIRFK